MGCGSRFWISWDGVLGRSLIEFGWLVEFGSTFFHLWFVGWLCFIFLFFFPSFVVVFGFGICWYCCCCLLALMFLLLLMIMGGDNILF